MDIPQIPCPLQPAELDELHGLIDPLSHSECFGMDIYLATIAHAYTKMNEQS